MIYLDNHSTTAMDPIALQAMLPYFGEQFANAGSITHAAGRAVKEAIQRAIAETAAFIGAAEDELVITSGATESNNLALFGTCLHPRQKRRRIVSVVSEHKAILDPLKRLEQSGFEVLQVGVHQQDQPSVGKVHMEQLAASINDDTALVTVMLANNEIGTIQPLADIAAMCREHGCLLHSDASQAVGRIPVNVDALDVDLLSFSGHKFYGPKGVGGLYVRRRGRRVRMQAQMVGGGQQHNFRSGTLNSPGIVGMSVALDETLRHLAEDHARIERLRNRMFAGLNDSLDCVSLNGPAISDADTSLRLAGNLNCCFYPLEGQSLMLEIPDLAASSGSACTSAEPEPSHVLRSIGLSEEQARSSLRFGIGRFNTDAQIDQVVQWLREAAGRLANYR